MPCLESDPIRSSSSGDLSGSPKAVNIRMPKERSMGLLREEGMGLPQTFKSDFLWGYPHPKYECLVGEHDSMSVGTFDMSLEHASQTIACRQGMETSPQSSSQLSCRAQNQLLLPSQRPSSSETISSFQPESILLSHWSH